MRSPTDWRRPQEFAPHFQTAQQSLISTRNSISRANKVNGILQVLPAPMRRRRWPLRGTGTLIHIANERGAETRIVDS